MFRGALLIAALVCLAAAARPFPGVGRLLARSRTPRDAPPPANITFHTQTLDHFNKEVAGTFQQRILTFDGYWGKSSWREASDSCPGPIFFYTGNESPVTDYYANSGFIFELARKHGAKVVFAEHRYFGESMPFGNASFVGANVGFLSPEQALADYATYLNEINPSSLKCPVVAFGGSYGGMLTAWFRMKYPNVVEGGLAASAPFGFYGTGLSEYAYMDAAQESYRQGGPDCDTRLGAAILDMVAAANTTSGRTMLSETFATCSPIESLNDGLALVEWVQNALIYMVELNYDEASDYGIQFPAWPLNATCRDLDAAWDRGSLVALAAGMQNYFNSSGLRSCANLTRDQPDFSTSPGWDYIACTEAYMPMAQRGMWYPHTTPDLPSDVANCLAEWNVRLQPEWSMVHWGGYDSFPASSNIIFSNGLVDPWHALGVLTSPSASSPVVLIPASAHHADLRGPDPADPVYLTEAREKEEQIIVGWLKAFYVRQMKE